MKILILGAGAVGGYFGGRFHQAGADVTFLVRPARAEILRRDCLKILSSKGDAALVVKVVSDATEGGPYDLVLLSCKAYDLDSALNVLAPGIGETTTIVPLLNGMKHLDALDARFGAARVVGGVARISSTLTGDGTVFHMAPIAGISTGERVKGAEPRPSLVALADVIKSSGVDGGLHADIIQDMWNKWIMLCSLAASTCMFRALTGDVLETDDGGSIMLETVDECCRVAIASGYDPGEQGLKTVKSYFTVRGSTFAASMLRDLEAGSRVEAAHVVGDMISRAKAAGIATPNLRFAYTHLQSYEQRMARETKATAAAATAAVAAAT